MAKKNPSKAAPPVTADGVPVHCAHDALVAVGELRPHPQNPKRHPPAQVDVLRRIIAATGWRKPVTVSRRSGYITAGHGRLKAAQAAGWAVVPVDYQDYAGEAQELADVLADNAVAELAEYDLGTLEADLRQLAEQEFDLDLTGINEHELDALLQPPGGGDAGGHGPASDGIDAEYMIIVTLPTEDEQRALFERLQQEGHQCKVVTS